MNRHVLIMAALVVALAFLAGGSPAEAQSRMKSAMGYGAQAPTGRPPAGTPRVAQAPVRAPAAGRTQTQHVESYPERFEAGAPGYSGPEGYHTEGFPSEFGYDGYGSYGGCDCDAGGCECGDCCDPCAGGGSWWDFFNCCGVLGGQGAEPRWFFTGEYLYVRANFSEAVAYLIHDDSENPVFLDEFHQLDFRHESSYRFGGGYLLGCCDEQVRFMFTRLSSYAVDSTTDPRAVGPFETSPGPGGRLDIRADVDVRSYDLEYAKRIPLGGKMAGCCDDPCDPCGHGGYCCPAWDLTWSGGVRFAEVNWQRQYLSNNPQTEETRNAESTLDFEGGGPRFGLEGRRYFGQQNWFSMFLKGDISLLLGHISTEQHRLITDEETFTPDVEHTQTARCRNIIPVTEIEAGLSARVTSGSMLSAGYLFSAWHDLGFRDQFDFATFLETGYDDANILGFDGFFVRFEAAF